MNHTLDFFHKLDQIMKQDFGNRGLLCSLPDNPVEQTFCSLASAKRVILLTGFPVKMADERWSEKPTAHAERRTWRRPF